MAAPHTGQVVGIWEFDVEANQEWCDARLERFLADLGTQNGADSLLRCLTECQQQEIRTAVQRSVSDGIGISVTFQLQAGDRIELLLLEGGRLLSGDSQRVVAICSLFDERIGKAVPCFAQSAAREFAQGLLIDAAPILVVVLDERGNLQFVNSAVEDLLGCSFSELKQIDWLVDFLEATERSRIQKALQAALQGKLAAAFRTPLKTRSGEIRIIEWSNRLVSPVEGKSPYLLGIGLDVTQLQQSETRYRQLFEMMTDGFALHEVILNDAGEPIDYRYLKVNRAFEELMECRREDVVGRCHSEFPSNDRDFWVKAYGEVALTGKPLHLEYVNPDSQRHWLVLAYRTQPGQFAALFSEVTQARRAEREKREVHDRLMMIIDNVPMVLFSVDREGIVTASQGKGLEAFGLKPNELVGANIFQRYPEPKTVDALKKALAGQSTSFLVEGVDVAFESHYEPIIDVGGQVIGVTGIALNVSEQRKSQKALRQSDERLRLLVEYTPAPVAMLDRDLRYVAYSRRWLIDYQLGEQDITGRSHYDVFPEIPERWREIHRRCLMGATERCERDEFLRSDGSKMYLRWEIQPWRNAQNEIGGLVFFTENITDAVLAEVELELLRNQVAHAGRVATMGEMMAGISHELNQPLAAIGLYAEGCADAVLASRMSSTELREKLVEIGALATRCGEIIRRLRNYASKREVRKSTVDLRDILIGTRDFLRHEFRNAEVQCKLELPPNSVWVLADAVQLQQVFINIVRNALEATLTQTPVNRHVEVGVRAEQQQLVVTIRDFGAGIPESQLSQLFTPFFTTKQSGLGMGLKISATIVQAHGGDIHCELPEGGGTRFVVRLPSATSPETR